MQQQYGQQMRLFKGIYKTTTIQTSAEAIQDHKTRQKYGQELKLLKGIY